MIRAGVVKHPCKWNSSAYHEFYSSKKRYRIINIQRLLDILGIQDIDKFRKWHTLTLDSILQKELKTEKFWSNAYAVGDTKWLQKQLELGGIKKDENI